MLLNIVTDDELFTSEIVKFLLILVLSAGIFFNLVRLFSRTTLVRRSLTGFLLAALFLIIAWVIREFRLEYALLNNPKYTRGITVGYCNITGRGEGIEFEYEINGTRFRRCNTFHPIPKDSIMVPGGAYRVRYSDGYADAGRMNFKWYEK